MDDLISRQEALDALCDDCSRVQAICPHYPCMEYVKIEGLPSAEWKKGKWIKHEDRTCWYCSECNEDNYYAYVWNGDTGEYVLQDHYCPHCGAEMVRGEADGHN